MQESISRTIIIPNSYYKCQCKNRINNRKGNMTPPKSSYPMTGRSEKSSAAEAQVNYHKNNSMKIMEILKEEMKSSFKETEKKTEKNG